MEKREDAREKIILALDTSDIDEARRYVEDLSEYVGMFKIGYELFSASFGQMLSPHVSEKEAESVFHKARALFSMIDGRIFFDTKFHDIPRIVKGAIESITELFHTQFITIHASAGAETMMYARPFSQAEILAVAVLSSISEMDAKRIFGGGAIKDHALRLFGLAKEAGADGFVVSPLELPFLGGGEWDGFIKVAVGNRPSWAPALDQKRYATPKQAIQMGADYLVIGSPILHPPKSVGIPRDAVLRIIDEIGEAVYG